MRKTLTLLLAAIVLVLGTATARLLVRVRDLEEELARGARRTPKPPAVELTSPIQPGPAAAEGAGLPSGNGDAKARPPAVARAAVSPGPASAAVPAAATKAVERALQGSLAQLTFQVAGHAWTLQRGMDDPALGLTEAQKRSIDDLRKTCDAQTQGYAEMIQKLEDATQQSIRGLLTAEQLSIYDGPLPAAAAPTPAGPRQGFLGVQGADQEGGGVKVVGVIQGSSASVSGLLPGDVILEVNGQPISNYQALASRIQEIGEGVPISLKISRGGTEFYHGLQLGGRN